MTEQQFASSSLLRFLFGILCQRSSELYAANSALDIKPSLLASYSSNVLLVKPELPLDLLLPHSPCDLTRGTPGVPLTAETL